MVYSDVIPFESLTGKHIASVEGLEEGSGEVYFHCADGSSYRMRHYQDCCEYVQVYDVIGDVSDLLDADVIEAREESSGAPSDVVLARAAAGEYLAESETWTFYIIQTNKGAVTVRWLGSSNGYYSEAVSFEKLETVNRR